jgi:putative transposase
MTYKPRRDFPGVIHHLSTRGNDRQLIYLLEVDRYEFLIILADVVERYGWVVLAYCLMGNHYHLVVETPEGNLAAGMRYLNGRYALRFNRRHGRGNHLFGKRYHEQIVGRDAHLFESIRYVVLNPVRARLCTRAGDWPWSSYAATAGFVQPPEFLATSAVLSLFDERPWRARGRFVEFVADGLDDAWRHPRAA